MILNWEAYKAVYTKHMISWALFRCTTLEVSLGNQTVETIIKVPKSIWEMIWKYFLFIWNIQLGRNLIKVYIKQQNSGMSKVNIFSVVKWLDKSRWLQMRLIEDEGHMHDFCNAFFKNQNNFCIFTLVWGDTCTWL